MRTEPRNAQPHTQKNAARIARLKKAIHQSNVCLQQAVDRPITRCYVRLQEGSGVAFGIPAEGPDTGTRPDSSSQLRRSQFIGRGTSHARAPGPVEPGGHMVPDEVQACSPHGSTAHPTQVI